MTVINWWTTVRTIALVSIYYGFSIGLTFFQKWFINGFHFPLSVVMCHLVIKFLLSAVVRWCYEIFSRTKRVVLPWSLYVKRVSAVGLMSALDIGFSNWSFEFITVSLYTMSKSSCIIFILIFALLFGLEKMRYSLIVVVFLISTGLFLFTYQSVQFNLRGFLLVMTASVCSGLRWNLAQLVMQKKELGLNSPVDMIYHIQPWMILGILPLAISIEGLPFVMSNKVFRYEDVKVPLETAFLVLAGSFLAFLMELSEFLLLLFTSSLSLSIAGIFKEVCTLYLAHSLNGDSINKINFIGLMISLFGIILHVILKALHSKEDKTAEFIETPLLQETPMNEEDDLFDAKDYWDKSIS